MILPSWGLGIDGAVLAVTRACWLAGLLSAAGALLFRALEPPMQPAIASRIMRLILASLTVALVGWLAWVAAQTAVLAGAASVTEWLHALPELLGGSAFGRLAVVQLGLLALTALVLRWGRVMPAVLAMTVVALQVGHLHAWAMEGGPGLQTVAALLHVLGAAAWLGGLLPLRIVVRGSGPALAAAASRRFSTRAGVFAAMLAVGAFIQGSALLGGLPGLVGTAYGRVVLFKLLVFAALLAMAARNRFRLTPALARPEPRATHDALVRSIGRGAFLGLLVVLAAALLSRLQPGMHVQPVWPFAWQPSLVTVREDAGVAREVIFAGLALLVAVLLCVLAVPRRPARWPALLVAAVIAWFAVPHLRLLLVPAYPTSFYRSPTDFAATSIADGEALYPQHCASCHGAEGRGDGPQAAHLPLPPADLTAAHLWMHSDGELFWWLTHGLRTPTGALAMPGFAALLDADARWHLIDYLRARNAGTARAATGDWKLPVQAPDVALDCPGGRSVTLAELRGKPVRLAFQRAANAPLPPTPTGPDATTVFVPLPDATEAAGGNCIASDPAVFAAYAVVTGLPATALAGSDVLIDANGWLRLVLPPGPPEARVAALRRVAASPLPAAGGTAMTMPASDEMSPRTGQ